MILRLYMHGAIYRPERRNAVSNRTATIQVGADSEVDYSINVYIKSRITTYACGKTNLRATTYVVEVLNRALATLRVAHRGIYYLCDCSFLEDTNLVKS
jgi:hypothetical protein